MRAGDMHPVDTGCEKASKFVGRQSKCIACPFLRCIDLSGGSNSGSNSRASFTEARRQRITELRRKGIPAWKVAARMGISTRTVYRYQSITSRD